MHDRPIASGSLLRLRSGMSSHPHGLPLMWVHGFRVMALAMFRHDYERLSPPELPMTTDQDARLDVMLDALCAFAEALLPNERHAVGQALMRRAAGRTFDDGDDEVAAADLARLLAALDCLTVPTAGSTNAV